ncbi:hypothetical protein HanRHA438_Chr05g0245511 [Helianthus annuus]|nr:hypothetical protein HanRHA438_Chr05g0245511 [Helianthus annuus]
MEKTSVIFIYWCKEINLNGSFMILICDCNYGFWSFIILINKIILFTILPFDMRM